MKTHYTYSNGKFVEDKDYVNIGKKAIMFYTGGVVIVEDMTFHKPSKKWTGTNKDGMKLTIRPSEIIEMKGVI